MLMENGVIDQITIYYNQSYKIINPVTEVLNLPPDDEVEIFPEISDSSDFDSQPSQFNLSNLTPIVNVATTPILNTAATPKHSDDIKTHIKSLEDKLLSKIAALKSHFFNNIWDLRNNYITLLKENNEKEKRADSNNKRTN